MSRYIKHFVICVVVALLVLPASAWAALSEATASSNASAAQLPATQAAALFNLTYDDAEEAISKALSEKTPRQTVRAVISGKKATPLYSAGKPVSAEVRGLRVDSTTNRWNASLLIVSDEAVVSAAPLSGRYMLMAEVPVLKRPLRNGDLISAADVEVKLLPQERTFKDTITDLSSLLGKTPVRTISQDRPIRNSEIAFPALIKKNAMVHMRYKTANMEITATGQALNDGAKGDLIEVRNVTSKKTTHATVFDENTVDVMGSPSQPTIPVEPSHAP